ncbi:MAG TPA: nucleotidyltransferase domain-containing protein [Nannocystis sp.]
MEGCLVIYETVHGSQAYGLNTATSDLDLKGVMVGPAAWYHGFRGGPEQIELSPDHVRYEIRKYFRLAAAANPTVLELLWTDPSCHTVCTPLGERLLARRDAFLSQRVKDSFAGYAMGQLARIKTHRKWVMNPPRREPTRADFGLPETRLVSRDQLGAVEAMLADGRMTRADLDTNFLEILERERRYKAARKEWDAYQGWLRTRNPKRSALEAEFGYDTKHGMHLIRLLRMGVEILEAGALKVRRDDRDELLAIRGGALTYDELMATADALHARVQAAAAISPLPPAPDEAVLDALCAELVEGALSLMSPRTPSSPPPQALSNMS